MLYKTHGAKLLRSILLLENLPLCDRAILSLNAMASRENKRRFPSSRDGASTTGSFQSHPGAMKKKKAGSGNVCTFPEPVDSSTTGMLHSYSI